MELWSYRHIKIHALFFLLIYLQFLCAPGFLGHITQHCVSLLHFVGYKYKVRHGIYCSYSYCKNYRSNSNIIVGAVL